MPRPRVCAVALLIGPATATAQDDPGVSATFAWNSIILSSVALAEGAEAYALETAVTVDADVGGALAGLRGRCILSGVRDVAAGRHQGTGHCVFTDASGDRLVQRVVEETQGPGTQVRGVGTWAGGTGRFAGAAGEVRYTLVSYGLQAPDALGGTGRAEGTLTGVSAAPPPEPPPALSLELVRP